MLVEFFASVNLHAKMGEKVDLKKPTLYQYK